MKGDDLPAVLADSLTLLFGFKPGDGNVSVCTRVPGV